VVEAVALLSPVGLQAMVVQVEYMAAVAAVVVVPTLAD
jgi:hypothetical protein